MCIIDLDFQSKFRQAIKDIETTGELYAHKKAKSWHSQELKHTVLASVIRGLEEMPDNRAERVARASDDYKSYLLETAETIKEELIAKAKYEKASATFEAIRSLCSLEKSTRNQIGE